MMDIKLRMSIYRMSTHPVINPRGVACNKKVNNVDVQVFKKLVSLTVKPIIFHISFYSFLFSN